jgi:hypothetical protein
MTQRFKITDGKYEWLRSVVFGGSLNGAQTEKPTVAIKVYRLR